MDQITFALLTGMVLLGKFADFIVQTPALATPPEGPAPSSRHRSFARRAVQSAEDYLETVFETSFWSRTRWVRVFLISAFLVQGSFLFSAMIVPDIWRAESGAYPFVDVTATVILLILVNFVADLIAISLVLYALRRADRIGEIDDRRAAVAYTLLFFWITAAFYLILVTTMNMSFSLILHFQGLAAGYGELLSPAASLDMHLAVLRNETAWRLLDPFGEGTHIGLNGVNLFFFCYTPFLAPLLVGVAALIGAFLDVADEVTSGRVGASIRSLNSDRRPFFLKLSSVVAVIGAGAATLMATIGNG